MNVFLQTLMEMGFPQHKAEKALTVTDCQSVEAAMEWLIAHGDDADDTDESSATQAARVGSVSKESSAVEASRAANTSAGQGQTSNAEPSSQSDANSDGVLHDQSAAPPDSNSSPTALSLKCDDCGKPLRSEIDAQGHAARTGHANFSESTEEIKPLTEEEKAEQLAKLQERIKKQRLEREEREKKETREREKLRRIQGKDITKARFEQEQKEIRQLAEQKRREKAEERAAKQKVLDEIRRDREDRAAQAASSKAAAAEHVKTTPTVTNVADTSTEKKEYTECKLQIRLPSGQPLRHTFNVNEPLAAVRLYVTLNSTGLDEEFNLVTTFPKKIFTDDDMEKPLSSLGLVPSAVLMVTKK